jgi:hypothetical protein
VLLKADTAIAPPSAARTSANANASFFIRHGPLALVVRAGSNVRAADGGCSDRATKHGHSKDQSKDAGTADHRECENHGGYQVLHARILPLRRLGFGVRFRQRHKEKAASK